MRIIFTAILLQFFITSCQSSAEKPEKTTNASVVQTESVNTVAYPMTPDTVEVRGKFLSGCTVPNNIRIAIHNVDNSFWKDVAVNPSGDFKYRFYLNEPRRVALRTIYGAKYDFFTTTNEKVYNVEITCVKGTETMEIKGSEENKAYEPFSIANKKFQTDLDSFAKQDISKKETFELVKKAFGDYQKTLADIAAANPNTFTAKVFCAAEKLPDGSWNSLESLRKNFLQREAYSNPQFYNDFAPQRILLNFIDIRDRSADANPIIEILMNIGLKNQEAAKRLQDVVYSIFYKMHQEDVVIAYINWAERNPDKMYNLSVKANLQNIKKVVAGSPYIDFQLNDPNGKPHKLSETVNSAKLTLLIFYSPTCGHCKEKVPEMKPLWDKYKSKGLKIYAAGHDANNDEWKTFINTNANPEWVHVFEYPEGPKPSDYYYAETPTFILIGPDGKIISRIGDLEFVKKEIEKRLQ